MQNIRLGFIGFGNMAQAIAQGLVDAGVVNGGDIVACAAHYDKLEASTAKLGARPLHSAREVAAAADVVVIAIKPYQIESVIKPIADEFAKNGRFVVSIAAGWDLAKYQKLFGDLAQSIHIQCTIPNTPMAVGKGVLVTETDNTLTDMQTDAAVGSFPWPVTPACSTDCSGPPHTGSPRRWSRAWERCTWPPGPIPER